MKQNFQIILKNNYNNKIIKFKNKKENGYIIVKNMFDDNDIEKWCNRFIEYADGKLQRKAGM